jgi:pilus assembly protein CpaF
VFSIVITEKGGAQRQLDFEGPEISVGRLEDNDICLPKNNVSKHHARLVFKDDRYVLVDQKSTNGTYVNGRRISAPMVVRKGDKIYIGDFILTLALPEGFGESPSGRLSGAPRMSAPPMPDPRPSRSPVPYTPEPLHEVEETQMVEPMLHATVPPTPSTRPLGAQPPPPPPAQDLPSPGTLRPPPPPREALRSVPPPAAAPAQPEPHAHAPRTLTRPSAAPPAPAPPPPAPAPPAALAGVTHTLQSQPEAPQALPQPPLPPERVSIPDARERASIPDAHERASRPAPRERVSMRSNAKSIPPWADDPAATQGGQTSPAALAPSVRLQGALSMLMERLATQMNIARAEEAAFPSEYQPLLERLMDELADEGTIGPDLDRRFLREAAVSEAVGLGPLDRLLANRSVREVVVDGPARILADLGGGLSPVSSFFSGADAVLVVAKRLMHRAGQKLDAVAPIQEGQLPGGGLVQLLMPPLSPKGPLITVRCPPRGQSSAESMVTDGLLSTDMLALLRAAVQHRQNILVLGPMGSGVSTLLAALTALAPDHERVVTIEDSPSVSLMHPQALPLSRHAAPDMKLSALLKNASRLRYDRLVIDDVAGEDALAALTTAASTTGVLLGTHAPGPSAALTQLELFAQAALGGSRSSLATLMAGAVQLLVHVALSKDGSRRVQSISEVRGAREDTLEVRLLYRHEATGFRATEHRASFLPS